MSNDTEFLARWSRRKHDAAADKIKQSKPENISGTLSPKLCFSWATKIGRRSTLRVCLQSNPSVPGPISAPSSKPGCLTIWRVRRFAACGR